MHGGYGMRLDGSLVVRERIEHDGTPEIESVTVAVSHPKKFHTDLRANWQSATLLADGQVHTSGIPIHRRFGGDPYAFFTGAVGDVFGVDITIPDRKQVLTRLRDGILRCITDPDGTIGLHPAKK
jgi:hypothetical protein